MLKSMVCLSLQHQEVEMTFLQCIYQVEKPTSLFIRNTRSVVERRKDAFQKQLSAGNEYNVYIPQL